METKYKVVISKNINGWIDLKNRKLFSLLREHPVFKDLIEKKLNQAKEDFDKFREGLVVDSAFPIYIEHEHLGYIIKNYVPKHHPEFVALVENTTNVLSVIEIDSPNYVIVEAEDLTESIVTQKDLYVDARHYDLP